MSEPQAWTRCVGRTRRRVSDQRLFPRGRGHGRAGQRFREALTLRAAIALPCRNCGAGERAVRLTLAPALQTIYNAITHGTPCVVVEGSGRVADVIAQVASLPISEITVSLIQQKLAVFFQELFETFTEGRIVEWTKKVRPAARGPWARLTYGARKWTPGGPGAGPGAIPRDRGSAQCAVLPSSGGSRTSRLQNLRPGLGSCRGFRRDRAVES